MAGTRNPQTALLTVGKLAAALVACGVLVAGMLLPYVGGLGLFAGHEASKFLDTPCTMQESPPPQKTTLYANDGKTVIATLFRQDRVPIALKDIPQYLQDALVATEDRRFYSHHGVDLRGLIRGAINTSSGDTQGGSTLTMQYVKQMRYYQAGDDKAKQAAAIQQTLDRKIEDAKCAIYFERTLKESKATILDNYLNIAFFGEHAYGIQTAAETYFNKPAKDLTLPESALLVGLLRAPSAYDPFVYPDAAKTRRNQVLDNLVAVHKLSQQQADRLKQTPVVLATSKPPSVREGCANSVSTVENAGFFCEYVRSWLKNVNGLTDTLLETGGLKIITTLDPKLQNSMQRHLQRRIPASSAMTAAIPAIDPRTGDVLAMASSKPFGLGKDETEQPIFTSYTADGQSTYKLFPMLAALQAGFPTGWQMETATNTGSYRPRNCLTSGPVYNRATNETYNQNETLTTAAQKSSNTFFVGLIDVGMGCALEPSVDMALKLGVNGLNQPSTPDPKSSWAKYVENKQAAQLFTLGYIPTSPLELAGAYAAIANGGTFNAPSPVQSITTPSGDIVTLKTPAPVRVVSPEVAHEAVQILQGDTQSFGTSADAFSSWYSSGGSDVAGKTGTLAAVNSSGKETSLNAAIWFVGMTPNLTAATAIFNLDNPVVASTGLPGMKRGEADGGYAAGVWVSALRVALGHDNWTWATGVPGTDVPDVTGMQPSEAKRRLMEDGFKMQLMPGGATCASSELNGSIAYYGPSIAQEGDTITVCPSSGAQQPIWKPAPKPKPSKSHGHGGQSGSGSGSSGGGGSASGSPPGGRGGGNGHGPGNH